MLGTLFLLAQDAQVEYSQFEHSLSRGEPSTILKDMGQNFTPLSQQELPVATYQLQASASHTHGLDATLL